MAVFNDRFPAYPNTRRALRFHASAWRLCATKHFRAYLSVLILVFCCGNSIALAQDAAVSATEYPIKAAFLYKFCLYIEWPPAAFAAHDSPFVFGIAAPAEFIHELNAVVEERTIGGRRVQIRRIHDSDVSGVHLLFVAHSEQGLLPQVLAQARSLPLVLVTESERGLDDGGTINFSLKNKRVTFDVSLDAANRQGLHLSAQLLKVASNVRGEVRP